MNSRLVQPRQPLAEVLPFPAARALARAAHEASQIENPQVRAAHLNGTIACVRAQYPEFFTKEQ